MLSVNLKIAIQKSGRLSEGSVDLLKSCGIKFENGLGKLKAAARNFPLEIFFLRDDDIPRYIEDGVADVGIVGENVIAESGTAGRTSTLEKLGFGRCRLSLAVPAAFDYKSSRSFAAKRVATSYPNILRDYFASRGVTADIHTISGSVEIAPSIGLADAVCDLVSSGSTLLTNGLKEVEVVMNSEAVLVARAEIGEAVRPILDKLRFRIRAASDARRHKYILLNAPNRRLAEIEALLPGIKSPTVMPLAESGWSSVHSVIDEDDYWEIIEKLKGAGAEGVLVVSIDQMVQ